MEGMTGIHFLGSMKCESTDCLCKEKQ